MRNLLHPLFILSAFIYGFLKISQKLGYHFPFFHDHLADFLCMPVVLGLALAFMRLVKQNQSYTLHPIQIISGTVLYGFLFEGIFPMISNKHIADWRDLIAYALGAILFWAFMNGKMAFPKTP